MGNILSETHRSHLLLFLFLNVSSLGNEIIPEVLFIAGDSARRSEFSSYCGENTLLRLEDLELLVPVGRRKETEYIICILHLPTYVLTQFTYQVFNSRGLHAIHRPRAGAVPVLLMMEEDYLNSTRVMGYLGNRS